MRCSSAHWMVGGSARSPARNSARNLRQVVLLEQLGVRVFLADGAEGGRRGEQRHHAVVGADAPERAGVGRADRLALVQDRGAAVEQRRIDDVAVADHPADVGARPPHFAGIDAVKILHRPFERDQVAAIVAHHALGNARRARGVEDVERIGGGDRHAFAGLGVVDRVLPHFAPVVVAAFHEVGLALRALQDEAGRGLVLGEIDRLIQQRFIGDDARALDAAARRQDHVRLGVVDAGGELFRREAAEHHRMHGADARAGEHGEHRFRHHRHVDDDDVAFLDAEVAQDGAEQLHLGQHAAVSEGLLGVGDGRIVDQRRLVVAAGEAVAVERVVTGVDHAAGEPAAVDAGVLVEDFFRRLDPVDLLGGLAPEAFRVALPARVDVMVSAGRRASISLPPEASLAAIVERRPCANKAGAGTPAMALILSKGCLPNWS